MPVFEYYLQTGATSPILLLCSPMFFFTLSMILSFSYPDYDADKNSGKHTLLVRLGWRRTARDNIVNSCFRLFVPRNIQINSCAGLSDMPSIINSSSSSKDSCHPSEERTNWKTTRGQFSPFCIPITTDCIATESIPPNRRDFPHNVAIVSSYDRLKASVKGTMKLVFT